MQSQQFSKGNHILIKDSAEGLLIFKEKRKKRHTDLIWGYLIKNTILIIRYQAAHTHKHGNRI